MPGESPRARRKPTRRVPLQFDLLERLELLTGGSVHHSLGSFIAPSVIQPRVSQPPTILDPHVAINTYEAGILGGEIQPIQQVVENQNTSQHSTLVDRVLGNLFMHAVLSDQDTYTLLNSPGMSALIGVSQTNQNSSSSTVTYVLPQSAVTIGDPTSTVVVPSSGNLPGFIAQVPTTNIRVLNSGQVSVQIPQASIPANAPPPTSSSQLTGALADVFAATGSLIVSALQTGLPLRAPNAPFSVPGLRLAKVLTHDHNFPSGSTHFFLRMFRVAVERGVFNLSSGQVSQVDAALQQFDTALGALNQSGTFTPAVPPAPPPLSPGQLSGTLEVSTGALQNLVNIAAGQTGLQLPNVGNFPGRIDVGYIFARNGDYGLVLTARGPLFPSPPFPPVDNVGSTIQVESSNASSLAALSGLRTVEGLSIGTALMGTVTSSQVTNSGVLTFANSAGYGAGMEYGTGIAYTQVIPLGNLNALVPQSPPTH
jgi:hypothetical protein